jgi:uncharacterized protein YqgV (UPF0045/DUF77 family)
MSVIVEFSIFPMDKGESLSAYVARALKIIQDSGLPYELRKGPSGRLQRKVESVKEKLNWS